MRRFKEGAKIVVDILDPHSSSFSDALPKAKGLAKFAEKHGEQFGRIELIHKVNGRIRRLNLKEKEIREQIYKAIERPHLDSIFDLID